MELISSAQTQGSAAQFSTNLATPSLALLDACSGLQLSVQSKLPLSANMVLWEASEKPWGTLSAQQAESIKQSLQNGGRLLLTLDAFPGVSPLLLGSVLPTTGFATQVRRSAYASKASLGVAWADPTFFHEGLQDLAIPFCFDIRPASAVERAQARYERYNFEHPTLHVPILAGSDFWSRSLLNREWTVRARCNDLAQLPAVVTGRYGAGKVAVVATSVAALGASSQAQKFWTSVLRWLLDAEEAGQASPATPGLAASVNGNELHLTITNPASVAVPVQVVVRALSADGAMLADDSGELQRRVLLAPQQPVNVTMILPGPSPLSDHAIRVDRPLHLRVGLVSGDGARLLIEQRLVGPQPALQLKIQPDNLYGVPYPFGAVGRDALAYFTGRMGAFVGAYAYPPGGAVHATVTLCNGNFNLAPLCLVEDKTTPGNRSLMALNDEATGSRLAPNVDKIDAYSMWTGKAGVENILEFKLPPKSQVTEVVLIGNYGSSSTELHNPGRVVIEANGRVVASADDLDATFAAGFGQARVQFPACAAPTITIRFPWAEKRGSIPRQAPWLGEIYVQGWMDQTPPDARGNLIVTLVNALSGQRQQILDKAVTLKGCDGCRTLVEATLPDSGGIQFYRLEATFETIRASAPLLTIKPSRPLLPLTALRPANCAGVGLNVSRGFREVFHLGTGTAEPSPYWSSPDDLIWAYSRQLKQLSRNARTAANRFYLTASDMRHYITPWCSFSNGELFFSIAASRIVENLKSDRRWANSDVVQLTFADRWDTGPDMANLHGWQDFVEFDKWLRAAGGTGLTGRTLQEVEEEVDKQWEDQWQAWQLQRYVRGVRSLHDAFASAGKTLVISAQGVPMVAGQAGKDLSVSIRGMSDDCTWSMLDNSPVMTTGRQMSELAFNPVWQMSASLPWGFNSAVFNNWQWHAPVGTTEPSRRHIYDRAWRSTLWEGGVYGSVYTYGFVNNVGAAYTMTEDDFQQWWYVQERHSLLAPDAPLGAGLMISTAKSADTEHIRFTCGDPLALDEARLLAQAFRNLHNAGVSVPFSANASALRDYSLAAPLIVLNLPDFSAEEVEMLTAVHNGGTRVAAFAEKALLSRGAAELFSRPGTLLIETSAATLSHADALQAAARLQAALHLPLQFPQGTAGYGFRSQDTTFVVVEDWLEHARHVALHVTKAGGARSARACNVNDHERCVVRDNGTSWVIEVALRSGDGVLIAIKETSDPAETHRAK